MKKYILTIAHLLMVSWGIGCSQDSSARFATDPTTASAVTSTALSARAPWNGAVLTSSAYFTPKGTHIVRLGLMGARIVLFDVPLDEEDLPYLYSSVLKGPYPLTIIIVVEASQSKYLRLSDMDTLTKRFRSQVVDRGLTFGRDVILVFELWG